MTTGAPSASVRNGRLRQARVVLVRPLARRDQQPGQQVLLLEGELLEEATAPSAGRRRTSWAGRCGPTGRRSTSPAGAARRRRRGRSRSCPTRRPAPGCPRRRRCCGRSRSGSGCPVNSPGTAGTRWSCRWPLATNTPSYVRSPPVRGRDDPAGGAGGAALVGHGDDRLDPDPEGDALVQAVRVGVRVQVGGDLVARREERVVGRHREARVARHVARGDEVQGLVVGVPVAADAVGRLEAVDLAAAREQGLEGGEAGGAGADDAVGRGGHAVLPVRAPVSGAGGARLSG